MKQGQKNNRFTRYKDQFDSIESTYKHIIYTNKGKCYELTGYSKGSGLPERKDKEILLQKVILRLINRGYLMNSTKIEFYKKHFIDNRHDVLILVLYPDRYEYGDGFDWILPFLNNVYDFILKNKPLDENIIVDRAKGFKKIGLDIELYKSICKFKQDFKTKMEELKKMEDIPIDVITKFYYTYKDDFI